MAAASLFPARRRPSAIAFITAISLSGIASLGAAAGSASATTTVLPCTARVESTPFARWGDSHSYFLMPNGGFEAGATNWALTGGAAPTSGNESYFADNAADSHSLVIPAGGKVTSPTICVGRGESSFRLFVKNPGVTAAVLHVQVSVQDPLTGLVLQTGFNVNSNSLPSGWSPAIRMYIPNLLGGITGTQNLTVAFSTSGTAATWSIDDVFVDPFRMR